MKKMGKKLIIGTAFAVSAAATAGCGRGAEGVYGPPQNFPQPATESESKEYDPSKNSPEAVYGPPEWFEGSGNYDPSKDVPEDVYGPPEWFQ